VPINKQTSIVCSQSGCSDDVFLDETERYRALGKQKRHYADLCRDLKIKMGIKNNWKKGKPLPEKILKSQNYQVLMGIIDKLAELDNELNRLRPKIKIKDRDFEKIFIDLIREKYPNIYKITKKAVFKKLKKEGER